MSVEVHLKFIVNTKYNESVKMLGNVEELGNWDVQKFFSLETSPNIFPF